MLLINLFDLARRSFLRSKDLPVDWTLGTGDRVARLDGEQFAQKREHALGHVTGWRGLAQAEEGVLFHARLPKHFGCSLRWQAKANDRVVIFELKSLKNFIKTSNKFNWNIYTPFLFATEERNVFSCKKCGRFCTKKSRWFADFCGIWKRSGLRCPLQSSSHCSPSSRIEM